MWIEYIVKHAFHVSCYIPISFHTVRRLEFNPCTIEISYSENIFLEKNHLRAIWFVIIS